MKTEENTEITEKIDEKERIKEWLRPNFESQVLETQITIPIIDVKEIGISSRA